MTSSDIAAYIGAFSGVISLGWLIWKSRPKLKISDIQYYYYRSRAVESPGIMDLIILLGNQSETRTSIQSVLVKLGGAIVYDSRRNDLQYRPTSSLPSGMDGGSSIEIRRDIRLPHQAYKLWEGNKNLELYVEVQHTHGKIHKIILLPKGLEEKRPDDALTVAVHRI